MSNGKKTIKKRKTDHKSPKIKKPLSPKERADLKRRQKRI